MGVVLVIRSIDRYWTGMRGMAKLLSKKQHPYLFIDVAATNHTVYTDMMIWRLVALCDAEWLVQSASASAWATIETTPTAIFLIWTNSLIQTLFIFLWYGTGEGALYKGWFTIWRWWCEHCKSHERTYFFHQSVQFLMSNFWTIWLVEWWLMLVR